MTFTLRIPSASIFALVSILSIGSAAATEAKANPDPQLCAEYLRDLAAYRRMAVLAGCQIPQTSDQVAVTAPSDTQFPPVEADEPASSSEQFPPVVGQEPLPVENEPATQLPPVVEASAEPASEDLPPASSGSSSGSGNGSGSSSSSFPPVETSSADIPDDSFEEPTDPLRAAIEEKLINFKEEAKARVRDAAITKAEEVKERVKETIKHKIEDAIAHHQNKDGAPTLRRAAKDAVKRMVSEHRHGGGLLSKLAQLRRR